MELYGFEVTPNKEHKLALPEGFAYHLSIVCLPHNSNGRATLYATVDGKTVALGTVDAQRNILQFTTDLIFNFEQRVTLVVKGSAAVHCSGYRQKMDLDDDINPFGLGGSDDDSEDAGDAAPRLPIEDAESSGNDDGAMPSDTDEEDDEEDDEEEDDSDSGAEGQALPSGEDGSAGDSDLELDEEDTGDSDGDEEVSGADDSDDDDEDPTQAPAPAFSGDSDDEEDEEDDEEMSDADLDGVDMDEDEEESEEDEDDEMPPEPPAKKFRSEGRPSGQSSPSRPSQQHSPQRQSPKGRGSQGSPKGRRSF